MTNPKKSLRKIGRQGMYAEACQDFLATWREQRPNAVAALEAEGQLDEALEEAAVGVEQETHRLIKQGLDPQRAHLQALRDNVALPDIEPESTVRPKAETTL